MTIKNRLIFLALLVTAGLLTQAGLMRFTTTAISEYGEVRLHIEEINSGMLMLRRHEKDFLARNDLKYRDKFEKSYAELTAKVGGLDHHLAELGVDRTQSEELAIILAQYRAVFNGLVEVQKRIGLDSKDGLYGSLRKAVHGVEDELKALDDHKLASMMLTLRRNEKDFMLRSDPKYVSKLDGNLEKMRAAIADSSHGEVLKSKLQGLLDVYSRDFHALADGYAEKGLSSKDGLRGKMRDTVHKTEAVLESLATEVSAAIDSKADHLNLMSALFSLLIVVLVLALAATLARSILAPVRRMMGVMARIRAEDDLTLRVDTAGKDEVAAMGKDLNRLLDDFQAVIREVRQSTDHVSTAAEELSSITDETNGRMRQQINDTEMVAAAIEEMSSSVQEVVNSTAETAQTTEQAEQAAARGSRVVNETVGAINLLAGEVGRAGEVIGKLEQESINIGTVLDVIRDIAEQTNLLALNAAIEAARAGEQGRGFAVVADEVRQLASRTQQSTQEIHDMIEKLQAGAREAVAAMEQGQASAEQGVARASEANDALAEITSAIGTIHEMASHIASASQQQGTVAGEVAESIGTIKHSVDETGHSVGHITSASGELTQLAIRLHGLVEKFKA